MADDESEEADETEDDEADVIEEFYNGLESIGEVAQG